jgi:signal transduction histidine kinase
MRRFWPSSLYGQILAVAALAMLLAQVVNTTLLVVATNARATIEASSMLVARVANQVERNRLSPQSARDDGQRRRQPAILIDVGPIVALPKDFTVDSELSVRAREYLVAVDPKIGDVKLSTGPLAKLPQYLRPSPMRRFVNGFDERDRPERATEAIFLTMKLGDGRYISAAAPIRTRGPFPPLALLFQTLTLYLAVLIPLALVARRIASPLRSLTDRVRASGMAGELVPMVPQGPSDVRDLIEAFNAEEARISALLMEKDVMLGAIGHDLKTPLASLRVRIENVDDDGDREKMANTVAEMVTILDDILVLARLGKSAEALQQTDMGALVETVVGEFSQDADIGFVSTERIVATVRPVLVRRAVRNLVSNALKYGGNARVSVVRNGQHILLTVDDDGPGIAPDRIDAIFQPFVRGDESRNRASGGSGLGLTIARAIARLHGGDVTLSTPAKGGTAATMVLVG